MNHSCDIDWSDSRDDSMMTGLKQDNGEEEGKGGGHICSDGHWTLSAKWLDYLNSRCSISSPPLFLLCLLHRLVGEPDSTGNVSGRVSRCSAQTSAPRASAQWASMGNIELLPPMQIVLECPSYSVALLLLCHDVSLKFLFTLHLLFLIEPSGVAPQIWEGSSWKPSCTVHPCIRGL